MLPSLQKFKLGPAWFAVAGLVAIGFAVIIVGDVRVGGCIMVVGLLVGAGARAVVDDNAVRDISVRSKHVDVAAYVVMAVAALIAFGVVSL